MTQKLDILVLAAHPDDAELSCSGSILAHVALGLKVGIVDLTKGELGTRGTPEIRANEAKAASEILGLSARENLSLPDGYLTNDTPSQLKIVQAIRKYRPEVLWSNAMADRHPNHGTGAVLAEDAYFLSGLRKIETFENEELQDAWRPRKHFHYIQDRYIKPDIVVDISAHWEGKLNSIKAYKSQFFNPDSGEPDTYISSKSFWDFLEARSREMGHAIGVEFGEGFTSTSQLGTSNLMDIL